MNIKLLQPGLSTIAARVARAIAALLPTLALASPVTADASATAPDDTAALFKTACAICHEVPETKAPPTDTLRRLPASQILMAMEFGKMQPQAALLKPEQRVRLAKWLAAEEDAKRDAWIAERDPAAQAGE